jgi:ubiquinone biosynthesis protein
VYGQIPELFFEEINQKPIASGSISQVYEAKFRGHKVAVKVRHPNIEKNIEKDLSIVFGASRFLSLFSLAFEIPIDKDSFREKLIEQLDFRREKYNL